MLYCLLEYVLQDDGDNLKFVVTKFSDDSFFQFTQEHLDEQELVDIVKEDTYSTNFFIRNGFLNWAGKTIASPRLANLKIPKKEYRNKVTGLYELLNHLSSNDALLLADDGKIIPATRLHVSKSTMDIYFGNISGGKWKSTFIIKNTDGCLEYLPFKFLSFTPLPPELDHLASTIGTKIIGGLSYQMYETSSNVLIYPLITPNLYVSHAMINLKSYQSELNGAGVAMLDMLLSKLTNQPEEPEVAEWEQVSGTSSMFGVSIKVDVPRPTKQDLLDMIKLINRNIKKLQNGQIVMTDLINAVAERSPGDLHQFAFKTALAALMRDSFSQLDKLNTMDLTKSILIKQKIKLDLEMYMYRAILYISDHEFEFGKSSEGVFEYSGWAPYATRLIKTKEVK